MMINFKKHSMLRASSLLCLGILCASPALAQQEGEEYKEFDEVLFGDVAQNPGLDLPAVEEGADAVDEGAGAVVDQAFEASMTGALPLSPEQIRMFLERYDDTQKAVQEPVYSAPKPKIGVEMVSLDPGIPPVEIKTSVGYVTTLNFIDVTGEEWPIQDIGWAGEYEILQPEDSSHVIRVTPMSRFGSGNISVRLVGLKTPVVLTLANGRDEVHYRADLRIPELGPSALLPSVHTPITTVAGHKDMTAILTGVLPSASDPLVVSGVDSRTSAYVLDGVTYVRTPHTLLSPGWNASVKSSDGMTVYQINDAPVLLLSDNGRITRAYLKKKEAIDGL